MKTQTIAGHKITLEEGKQYVASRPMAQRFVKTFPIWITEMDNYSSIVNSPKMVALKDLTYDEANEFLTAFNNGETSFSGRIW